MARPPSKSSAVTPGHQGAVRAEVLGSALLPMPGLLGVTEVRGQELPLKRSLIAVALPELFRCSLMLKLSSIVRSSE
jgi:hypothetical protein